MSAPRRSWTNYLLNGAILLTGTFALILLYALLSHFLNPQTPPVSLETEQPLSKIQVEVRNGCGKAGVAGRVTRYLREQGYDVVESGNYQVFDVAQTVVLDRSGDMDAARRIADDLGVQTDGVKQELKPELYLDTSVIVGRDYEGLLPFQQNP